MSGWPEVELGAHTESQVGFPFKSAQFLNDPDDAVRLLRGDNVGQGTLRWEGAKHWPARDAHEFERFKLAEGDVILAMDRPWIEAGLKFAYVRQSDLPCLLVQRVTRMRGGATLDTKFLRFLIRSKEFTDYVLSITTGVNVPHISSKDINRFRFLLPPLETQCRIASILGAYDDLIEVNRRRVAVLEEMARGLFEEWFVRFRFPGHETVPILDTPDGPLPEGWGLFAFGDLLDVSIGGLWGEVELSGECPNRASVVRGTDFSKIKAGNFSTVPDRFVSSRELGGRLVQAGDIILEASGGGKDQPVGRVIFTTEGLIERLRAPVVPASFCRLIRSSKQSGLSEYAFGLLEQMYLDNRIEKFQKQSTGLRNFSMRQLSAESVILPPDKIIAAFGKIVRPWLELQSGYRNQIHVLAASRDLLLPRLISGQLSVASAERELEKVA